MIKVDHAGENGAVCIYRAQALVARIRAPDMLADIHHFLAHELNHREIFAGYLKDNGIRRCVSYTLCGIGGYLLGLVTGLIGKNAIHATTYAVESVVVKHLAHQIEFLDGTDRDALDCVNAIFADEHEHLALATTYVEADGVLARALIRIVQFSTESVIRFGMR